MTAPLFKTGEQIKCPSGHLIATFTADVVPGTSPLSTLSFQPGQTPTVPQPKCITCGKVWGRQINVPGRGTLPQALVGGKWRPNYK